MTRKWIQSASVMIDDATGALLVQLNGSIIAGLGATDAANLAAAKADLDALAVNARIPDSELTPAKVSVYAGGYQFLGQVGAGKVGRFVSWFITGQNAGAGVLTLGYSDDNAGNTAWTPVMVINAAANGGGNRENPNALKALCTPTIPTGKYLGIRATGTAFDGLVVTGVSGN